MLRGIAITVRFAGPTNYRGARWIARADHPEGRIVVSYDYGEGGGIDNARTAADALITRWNDDRAARGDPARWEIVAGGHTIDGYAFIASFGGAR